MEKKTNDTLIVIATVILLLMGALLWYQNKTIKNYEDIINKTDTTQIISTDTLYMEKTITDTVPKYINQVIFKTDTVYQKEGDSISAQPMLITLKKKITPRQL